jgi:hypothetical protein
MQSQIWGERSRVANKLPPQYRNSKTIARAYNLADNMLSYALSLICQNYMFVARKDSAI